MSAVKFDADAKMTRSSITTTWARGRIVRASEPEEKRCQAYVSREEEGEKRGSRLGCVSF